MNDYWNTKLKDMNTEGPTMSAGSADDSRVSAENNKIYFYSGVTRQDNLVLNKLLHSTGNKLRNTQNVLQLPDPPKVYLHINSYGGSVFAGFDRDWETPE